MNNKTSANVCSMKRLFHATLETDYLFVSKGGVGSPPPLLMAFMAALIAPVKKDSRQRWMRHCNMSQNSSQAVVNVCCAP